MCIAETGGGKASPEGILSTESELFDQSGTHQGVPARSWACRCNVGQYLYRNTPEK